MSNKTIRVLFDDVFFQIADSGIARVWREALAYGIRSGSFEENCVEIVLLNRSGKLSQFIPMERKFPHYDMWQPATDRDLLSNVFKEGKFDVFVSSYFTFIPGVKNLVIVHDLIPEKFGFSLSSRGWLERKLGIFCSDEFICVSQNTKNDLIEYYPHIPESRVRVAYPGINQAIFFRRNADEIESFKRGNSLKNYIIFIGSRRQISSYKNSKIVFQAVANAREFDYDVVCIGGEDLSNEEIQIIEEKGRKILRLNLSDEQLAICASGATALIYPSLYEGFGMPPLECLSVGTPVITTRLSSLPEVVGQLSIEISGYDPDEILKAIQQASHPDHVKKIRAEGPSRAKNFQWRELSDALIGGLKDVHDRKFSENDLIRHTMLERYTEEAKKLQSLP